MTSPSWLICLFYCWPDRLHVWHRLQWVSSTVDEWVVNLHLVICVNRKWKPKFIWWQLNTHVNFWFGFTSKTHTQQLLCSFVNMWCEIKHGLLTFFSVLVFHWLMVPIITQREPSWASDADLCFFSSCVNSKSDKHRKDLNILRDSSSFTSTLMSLPL